MTCLRFESDEGDRWGKRAASDVTWKVLDWDGEREGRDAAEADGGVGEQWQLRCS